MKKFIIIPARFKSSRLPGKVILDLDGKSVIQRVYEQCSKVVGIEKVLIAIDHIEVEKVVKTFTNDYILTCSKHESGTDRIAEAIELLKDKYSIEDNDLIINVQGDEPMIEPLLIKELIDNFKEKDNMITACHKIHFVNELKNPNVVKVIKDNNSNAIYFSRSIIPHHRDEWESLLHHHENIPEPLNFFRHLGIYGYRKSFLIDYSNMKQTYLERLEKLEQLRVIENGYKIKIFVTEYNSIGVDTILDYEKIKNILEGN